MIRQARRAGRMAASAARANVFLASIALLVAAAGAVWFRANFGPQLAYRYDRWRYPAIRDKLPYSADLDRALRQQRLRSLDRDYRRVVALLQEARRRGSDVDALMAKLPRVQRLAREGKFDFARMHLNSIELRVPRPKESIRAARAEDPTGYGAVPAVRGGARQ